MDIQESANGKETVSSAAEGHPDPTRASTRPPIDRLELQHPWEYQAEEEQAEQALNRYAQAARQRLYDSAPKLPDSEEIEESEEEREARSQQLKLQQKWQDIAAQVLVDELENDPDGENKT